MREYVTVFLVAAAVTYLLTVVAREIALRTGATARVRDRDVHAEPVPYLGGLAMYGGLVAAYVVARHLPFLSQNGEEVFHSAKVVLIAGGIICLVGVADDILELDALTKFGGQLLAAGFLVWQGIQLTFFIKPDGGQFSLQTTQAALLTVFIIVAAVNAVNFIDGLDGLAAGVVGIGAAAFFLFCYQLSYLNKVTLATTGALLSAAVAGVCVGFLPHNVHPARLFMGDSGSMLLGLTLAASEFTLTRQFSPDAINAGAMGTHVNWVIMLLPLALPLSIMLLPLADLVLAVVRRTRAGRSPFAPDKQHLHHRMLEIGHSHRRAVFILWLWAALLAFGTVVVSLYTGPLMWWSLLAALLLTIAATFILPIIHRPGSVHDDPIGDRVDSSTGTPAESAPVAEGVGEGLPAEPAP